MMAPPFGGGAAAGGFSAGFAAGMAAAAQQHGLAPPPLVSGVNLYAVANANSTYGHHGEMAWLQIYYVEQE